MTEVRSASAMRARRENEIRHMMTKVFTIHNETREAFAKRLTEGLLINAFAMRPVLAAQADMLPWGRVQQLTRTGTGLYPAMLEVRQHAISTLLAYGEAQSSDLLALDVDRTERNGLRRFVKATARFVTPVESKPATDPEAPGVPVGTVHDVVATLRRQAAALNSFGLNQKSTVVRNIAEELDRATVTRKDEA